MHIKGVYPSLRAGVQRYKDLQPWLVDESNSQDKDTDKYRQKAVNSMSRIYAGATKVLVSDPELQTEESAGMTSTEWSLAVNTCPWMARSWTLQEKALDISVYLKSAPEVKPYSDLYLFGNNSNPTMVESTYRRDILSQVHPELSLS